MFKNLLKKYDNFTPFTDHEAWGLFRIAAIAEAFGWSALIFGLYFRQYIRPGNNDAVDVAGQIHGTLFLIYLAASIVFSPSLKWSRKIALVAIIASILPYGSLVFEQIMAHRRKRTALRQYTAFSIYVALLDE